MDAQLRLLNPPPAETAPAGDTTASASPHPTVAPTTRTRRSTPRPAPARRATTRPAAWRLSADTRKIGRRGVAQARAALHSARHPLDDSRPTAA